MNLNKSITGGVLDLCNDEVIFAEDDFNVENSFFENKYHGSKILVLAPHQDDEINVAGAMILNLKKARAEIFVAFTTNGDFEIDAKIRSNEANTSLAILGIKPDHIIFLGYGDTFNNTGKPHIFNAQTPTTSPANHNETYSAGDFTDYAFKKRGTHSSYTRQNFFNDLKDLILDIQADVIFCVDFDKHADHRTLSLIFEEVIAEILKTENNNYKPEIYKKFAYANSFTAIRDFYSDNLLETKRPSTVTTESYDFDIIDHANYSWFNRVRFPIAENCRKTLIAKNPLARAIFAHKSQRNEWNALGILNSDEIFFERRTDNLIYSAKIKTTSGDGEKVRDFHIINTDNVDVSPPIFNNHIWQPDQNDTEKILHINWKCIQQIEQIKIYGDINSNAETQLKISPDNNFDSEIKLPRFGRPYIFNFDEKIFASQVEIKILNEGGISEIEIFSEAEPQRVIKPFIKITIEDNFVYEYFVSENVNRLEFEIYKFHIDKPVELSVSDGVIYCRDDKFVLKFDGDNVTIRAEIAGESDIFDQIKISRKSKLFFKKLQFEQLIERSQIHLRRKFKFLRD